MLSPEVLLTFFAASLLLGIAPGPDNIFVLTQSAVYGVRAGLATTLGLVTGLCVHTTAVALGVAALFQTSPLAFAILKYVGAAYLLYLAWLSFRAGALLTHAPDGGRTAFPGYGVLYRRGIVMNVTNPKVTLFFLAFLPQFCNPALGGVAEINNAMTCTWARCSCWPPFWSFFPWPPWAAVWPSGSTAPGAARSWSTGPPGWFSPRSRRLWS